MNNMSKRRLTMASANILASTFISQVKDGRYKDKYGPYLFLVVVQPRGPRRFCLCVFFTL
jgi:hypothetical protein